MYRIADLNIKLTTSIPQQIERMRLFESDEMQETVCIKVSKPWFVRLNKKKPYYFDESRWHKTNKGLLIDFFDKNQYIGKIKTQNFWHNVEVKINDNTRHYGYSPLELVIALVFKNLILQYNGLVLHSSALKYKNECVLFSAASGTGKTTHTTLWETHRGAQIINDDTPAIRIFEEEVYVYGTPWSGSSEKFTNDKLPLKAIVLLEQSPVNEMIKLTPKEAVSRLMPRVFLPYQDETLMKIAIDTVSQLIERVPIYLLKCRPDIEAMALVEETLWK